MCCTSGLVPDEVVPRYLIFPSVYEEANTMPHKKKNPAHILRHYTERIFKALLLTKILQLSRKPFQNLVIYDP